MLYGPALGFSWTADDPAILVFTARHAPSAYLTAPAVYQAFSKAFFFPGLLLSFDLDRLLFGLAPAAFYVHQLVALAVGAFLLHVLLRRWMRPLWSLLGALLFLAGPPLANVAPQLGVRHYVDGLVLALAALLLFRRSVEGEGPAFGAAAALCAFLAMACKEVYVPVVLLALILPTGTFARRLWHALPLLAAAAAYVAWRQAMLAGYAGGYTGSAPGAGELLRLTKRLLEQAGDVLFGASTPLGRAALAALGVAVLVAVARAGRAAAGRVLVCGLVALGPLLPVGESFQARYGLVPWAFVAAASAFAADAFSRGRGGRLAGAAVFVLVIAASGPVNRRRFSEVVRLGQRSRVESTLFFDAFTSTDVLRLPVEQGSFYENLAALRTEILHRPPAGRAVFDDLFFCRHSGERLRAWGWDEAARAVRPLGPPDILCAPYAAGNRDDAPLSLLLTRERGVLAWSFGPYAGGGYSLLLGDELVRYDLPREGRILPVLPDDLVVTLRYQSPEGWRTFSPALPLSLVNGRARVAWSR